MMNSPLNNNLLLILGAGESGTGAALLAKHIGRNVVVSDFNAIADKYKQELTEAQIFFEEGGHSDSLIEQATEVVKSPGIPDSAPVIQKLIARNVPILSELEYAARFTSANFIAITGSNGKTTTTMLAYHLLKQAGVNVGLGGNIGTSLARQIIHEQKDWYVLEVSSFQLDNMYQFHANIAVLCNITPDHLDRYNYVFQNYVDSKFRIIQNQTEADTFITFRDGGVVEQEVAQKQIHSQVLWMNLHSSEAQGASVEHNSLLLKVDDKQYSFSIESLPIQGQHNQLNAMAAIMAAMKVGLSQIEIETALATFINAPHRLEKVADRNGILWINDSKATNVDSVKYALGTYTGNIIWIAGGVDKGNDYSLIASLVAEKVKCLIILGKYTQPLMSSFGNMKPTYLAESMEDAILQAKGIAKDGDIVLLSPACASFDLFKNYEHRGDEFRRIVQDLT